MKVRRLAVSLASVISTVSLSLMTATPAQAALQPMPDTTWMTNGQVRAVLVSGNYLYVGGKFSKVRQFPVRCSRRRLVRRHESGTDRSHHRSRGSNVDAVGDDLTRAAQPVYACSRRWGTRSGWAVRSPR